jgi:tetratricopeptide (TPR) repeat protein
LATDAERVLGEAVGVEDEALPGRQAFWLRRLAVIRWKLGELDDASRLFGEAAGAYLLLGSPTDRETAAAARIEQSTVLMADGRTDDALRIIEGLIEPSDGFPEFQSLSAATRFSALESWQILLEKREEYERLHRATGLALELLDRSDETTDSYALAKTLVRRAKATAALDNNEAAVDLYEQAIRMFEEAGPVVSEGQLLDAMYKQALLLSKLGRLDDLATAFERLVARFGGRSEPWAQQIVVTARDWLESSYANRRPRRLSKSKLRRRGTR